MTNDSAPVSNETLPLQTVLTQLQKSAEPNFAAAHPAPGCIYHSTPFTEHERRHVFMAEWICIGRADELPNPGDFLTHEIAGVPVFSIRQDDGSVRAFVNACAHRFACLLPDETGTVKRITCRYHAWTYGPDGTLLRAPSMEMRDGFDKSRHSLRPLHTEIWEGFIYVTLMEEPRASLSDSLAPFRDAIVGRYDMARYRTVYRRSMMWNANWKCLIGNFTESYHVPFAHTRTFADHKKRLSDYVCGEDSDHYCYHYAAKRTDEGGGVAHPTATRLDGDWRRTMVDFCIFPCHLVTLMPDYLWYISVQPDGTDKMRATWGLAVPPEFLNDVDAGDYDRWLSEFVRYMDVANTEDKVLVEALHAGTKSPHLPEGTYHPIERNLWQFNKYLARCCC